MKGIKKLMRWAKPYTLLFIIIVIFTVLNPLTYSYIPQFIRYVINVVLEDNSVEGVSTLPSFFLDFFSKYDNKLTCITIVGVTLVLCQLLRGIMMFVNGYVKGKMAESIAFDMRTRLYSHIQNLSYTRQNNLDTGDLIQRCTSDIDTIKSFLTSQLPEILYIIASFASGAYQMYMIEKRIMLVTLIVAPISIVSSLVYFKYVTKKFEEIEDVEASMTTALQENINGVRVVKAFDNEAYEIEKFDKRNMKYRKKSEKLSNAMGLYWGLGDFLTMLQYALTTTIAILLARKGIVNTADIIACMMYIGMLVYPIRGLGRIIGDFGKATVASNRIYEVLDIEDEYEQSDGILEPEIKGNIEFKNVSFKFSDSEENLLNNISFNIKKGETVALVGKTGSGKSTIAAILTRLLEYNSGEVLLDGVNLKDISKKYLRKNVGIILQDPFLYAKTIIENIRVADPTLSDEEVYEAAKIASIHSDILEFSDGYNTLVGEKGVTLSGGQKQRIAIARMLILKKPIMIFDDSLSAVDTKTDLKIRNALKERKDNLTTIIITHRITTAKEADKIIVLEKGVISEIGTHQELANKEGLYKTLWDIQGALEKEFDSTRGGESDE